MPTLLPERNAGCVETANIGIKQNICVYIYAIMYMCN